MFNTPSIYAYVVNVFDFFLFGLFGLNNVYTYCMILGHADYFPSENGALMRAYITFTFRFA